MADVALLADEIGPREATSEAFRRAAQLVEDRFAELGYDVRRQDFAVPSGVSWGVDVPAGSSTNVIATLPGTRLDRRHVVLGAHLDTVPQAPGAEDNASGIAVMLEVARLVASAPPTLPVVFVAFGAEEPRGSGDDLHHFGSMAYVAAMSATERSALVGAIALDRVGVGVTVPISSGGQGPPAVRNALVAGAAAAGVPNFVDEPNRSSDHWSFERAGLPGARVGSTPYAGYHSPADVPAVVDVDQLGRVLEIIWTTLQALT
jgi:Zn-dependent M28 family amino/carboxypeptidase